MQNKRTRLKAKNRAGEYGELIDRLDRKVDHETFLHKLWEIVDDDGKSVIEQIREGEPIDKLIRKRADTFKSLFLIGYELSKEAGDTKKAMFCLAQLQRIDLENQKIEAKKQGIVSPGADKLMEVVAKALTDKNKQITDGN